MDIDNATTFQAVAVPGWSPSGHWQYTLVVKAGFRFDTNGQVEPLDGSDDIVLADEFRDAPEHSSLLAATEVAPTKSALDLLLCGSADVPSGKREHSLSLRISSGTTTVWEKSLVLFGPRTWHRSILGMSPSKPKVIEQGDLIWERAFGGVEADPKEADKLHQYSQNPAGVGWAKNPRAQQRQRPLPEIEQYPLLTRPHQQPVPAGFGPVPGTWSPRGEAFQTLDNERAAAGKNPYPKNPSPRLFQCAPEDQQLPLAYSTGHRLTLSGFYHDTPELTLSLDAPELLAELHTPDGINQTLDLQWDTLLLNITDKTLHWVGRIGIPSDFEGNETRQCALTTPAPVMEINHD